MKAICERTIMVAERYTIADIAIYGCGHLAGYVGYNLAVFPFLRAWLDRVQGQPGYIEDVSPYPTNAGLGAGRSMYG